MCELHKLDASFKPALFHLKYPHVFHLSECKKSQPNDNTFKLAVAQVFTYYHAFTGHQYTSKRVVKVGGSGTPGMQLF